MKKLAEFYIKAAKIIERAPCTEAKCRRELRKCYPSGYACDVLGKIEKGEDTADTETKKYLAKYFKPHKNSSGYGGLGWFENKKQRILALLLMAEMAKNNDL